MDVDYELTDAYFEAAEWFNQTYKVVKLPLYFFIMQY